MQYKPRAESVGRGLGEEPPLRFAHLRMDDGFEPFQRFRIPEHTRRELHPVNTAILGTARERRLDLRLIGALSGAMLPAIMPSFFRGFSGIDFRDPRARKAYVRTLVEAARLDR